MVVEVSYIPRPREKQYQGRVIDGSKRYIKAEGWPRDHSLTLSEAVSAADSAVPNQSKTFQPEIEASI